MAKMQHVAPYLALSLPLCARGSAVRAEEGRSDANRRQIILPGRRVAPPEVVARARTAYAINGRRGALLGDGLFSDPAWDILLDLFVSECGGKELSVTAVCIGSRSSAATALRYIALLKDADLIRRIADRNDGRRTYVRLTDRGWQAMIELLDVEGAR